VLATTALAGRLAVAQPSGAWIGGYRRQHITGPDGCKALVGAAFIKSAEHPHRPLGHIHTDLACLGALLRLLPSARMLTHRGGGHLPRASAPYHFR
jgi:hypothetical protein